MAIFISSLVRQTDQMEELAEYINAQKRPWLGAELIAFTHDPEYWERLCRLLEKLSCPVTFHGPYIGVEGTSPAGSQEQAHLFDSYRQVMALAAKFKVRHIVYHYTQLGTTAEKRASVQQMAKSNMDLLLALADEYQVTLLIENLPNPIGQQPLFDSAGYESLFLDRPQLKSIIDIGHAHMNGMELEGFLDRQSKRVEAYHFHNNNGVLDQHQRMADGTFDFKAFAGTYQKYTPEADIVLEYEPHTNMSNEELLEEAFWVADHFLNKY